MGAANAADVPVDQGPLQVATLAHRLYGAHAGRPAIVIGGGPSAPRLLEQLKPVHREMVVISANGHAWKLGLGAHYIVCKDNVHTETKQKMEELLRPLGAPIIARHYWADYRLASWPIQGNSGQMALGVAAMMGCAPIFPVGFDCYVGPTYFHAPDVDNVSRGITESMWRSRYQRLQAKLATADIRLLEPSLAAAGFGVRDLSAPPRGFCIPPIFDGYKRGGPVHYVRARRDIPMKQNTGVIVPAGYVFPVDSEELRYYAQAHHVDIVDNPA